VSTWRVVFTWQAKKDAAQIARPGLRERTELLLAVLREDPYQNPPQFEKLAGAYSRRINIKHRLVYQVISSGHTVKVLRMWTHQD
jgi:Txe/YoeB family toxin of toxin-antitoxin system